MLFFVRIKKETNFWSIYSSNNKKIVSLFEKIALFLIQNY